MTGTVRAIPARRACQSSSAVATATTATETVSYTHLTLPTNREV